MIQLKLLWAWTHARLDTHLDRSGDTDDGEYDAGFTTLEWVAIAGVVIVAAIVIATILMNTAKGGADNVKVQ